MKSLPLLQLEFLAVRVNAEQEKFSLHLLFFPRWEIQSFQNLETYIFWKHIFFFFSNLEEIFLTHFLFVHISWSLLNLFMIILLSPWTWQHTWHSCHKHRFPELRSPPTPQRPGWSSPWTCRRDKCNLGSITREAILIVKRNNTQCEVK